MSGLIVIGQIKPEYITRTADSVHPGGDALNCLDGNTYTSWKPDANDNNSAFELMTPELTVINYFAMSGLSGIGLDFDYATLYASDAPDYAEQVIIADISSNDIQDGILYALSDNAIAHRYYKVSLTNISEQQNAIEVSNIIIGKYISLPHGIAAPYTPPKLSAKTEILNNRTMGGHFVGRSVLSGQYDFIIKNKNVSPEWIEENWLDLHKQISEKPFMYLWDDSRPQDAVFCWTKGDIPPPRYDNQCYFSFSIPCNGFIEND